MTEKVLLWSSYLMIVTVVILGINGVLRFKLVTKELGHSIYSIFTVLLPFVPVMSYILLYMLLGYPESLVKLTSSELVLFNIALESVAAGLSVIVLMWLVMLLDTGLSGVIKRLRSRYLRNR